MNKEYVLFGRKLSSESVIVTALGFLMIVLIFGIIVPQIQGIAREIEKHNLKSEEVQKLQASLQAMNAVSNDRLQSDVELLTDALPTNKEVVSLFSSIIALASESNVQVRGFTIQVGEIYATGESTNTTDSRSETGFPSMNVLLSLSSASQRQVVPFTQALYKNFPIAKVNAVAAQDGSSSLEISFYYRPYNIERLQNSREVPGYTNQTLQLLEQLRATN